MGYSLHSRVRIPVVTSLRIMAFVIFLIRVGGVFAESRWLVDEPWRRFGLPFSSRVKVKGQEVKISEGCGGVWLPRTRQLTSCRFSEVPLLRTIPCRGSGVKDEDDLQYCPQVFT